jgi:hypothetical protein
MTACFTAPSFTCTAGQTRKSEVCARDPVTGCPSKLVRIDIFDATCAVVSTVYTNLVGVPVAGFTPDMQVDCAQFQETISCSTSATPLPITLTGQDCTGVGVPAVGSPGQLVEVVQRPGQVLSVKICTPSEYNREVSVLCNPANGFAPVNLVTLWPESAVPGTPPTVEAYNPNGTPFVGAIGSLVKCPGETIDIVSERWCANGAPYERISFFDVSVTPSTLVSTMWRDNSGAVVPDPVAGSLGECVQVRKVLIYHQENTSGLTMGDIVTVTGANIIHSVTVVQISGVGAVYGDSGGGAPLFTGQLWSWSAATGGSSFIQDTLSASGLKLDPGAGSQHVTAIYS